MAQPYQDPYGSSWLKYFQDPSANAPAGGIDPSQDPSFSSDTMAMDPTQGMGQPSPVAMNPTPLGMMNKPKPQVIPAPMAQKITQMKTPPDKLRELYAQVSQLPEIQDQKKGLADYQNAMTALFKPGADASFLSGVDLSPLASLANAWGRPGAAKIGENYQKPVTQEQLLGYGDELQKRREALTKDIASVANTTRWQNIQEKQAQRQAATEDRITLRETKDFDTQMKYYRDSDEAVNRLKAELSTPIVTSQQLAIANEQLLTLAAGSDKAGEGRLSRVEYETWHEKLAALLQKANGGPVDIGSTGILQHIQDLANRTHSVISANALDRINGLKSGLDAVQTPAVRTAISKMIANYQNRFSPGFSGHGVKAAQSYVDAGGKSSSPGAPPPGMSEADFYKWLDQTSTAGKK